MYICVLVDGYMDMSTVAFGGWKRVWDALELSGVGAGTKPGLMAEPSLQPLTF